MTHKSIIERAAASFMDPSMESHQQNAAPLDPIPQGLKEYEECIRELRRRLEAAGRVS